MTNTNQSPAGDVEAREDADDALLAYLRRHGLDNLGNPNERKRVIDCVIGAYLAKLTSTKAEPSRIAEILKRWDRHLRALNASEKHPGFKGRLPWEDDLQTIVPFITAIEADRDRMREVIKTNLCVLCALEKRDQLPPMRKDIESAIAGCRAALKSSKPGEGGE